MRQLSGGEFGHVLERHGWTLLRDHGSRRIYGKPGSMVRLSVPIHGHKPLEVQVLKHLLKMAGLTAQDLE